MLAFYIVKHRFYLFFSTTYFSQRINPTNVELSGRNISNFDFTNSHMTNVDL